MNIKKVNVTPKRAAQWLKMNFERNHKIRPGHVSKLAYDMKEGKWKDTGETIKINTMGNLVDGQHRLTAIVESGCTIELWVATDVPTDAINAIDTGASRSASDVMAIRGNFRYPKHLPTLVRRIIAWQSKTGDKRMNVRRGMSIQRIMDFCEQHPGLDTHIVFSFRAYSQAVNTSILTQGEWAFLHWLFSQTSETHADQFLLALATLDAPTISPIRTLFKRLNGQISLPAKIKINYCIRSWNAWRNGQEDVELRVKTIDKEPLPELV